MCELLDSIETVAKLYLLNTSVELIGTCNNHALRLLASFVYMFSCLCKLRNLQKLPAVTLLVEDKAVVDNSVRAEGMFVEDSQLEGSQSVVDNLLALLCCLLKLETYTVVALYHRPLHKNKKVYKRFNFSYELKYYSIHIQLGNI